MTLGISSAPPGKKAKSTGNQVCPKAPLQKLFHLLQFLQPRPSATQKKAPEEAQCPELPQAASAAQKEEGRAGAGPSGTTGGGLGDSAQQEPPWDSSEPACSHQPA